MKPRMNFYRAAPNTIRALMALETQIQSSGLEKSLIELIKARRLPDQWLRLLHQHAYPGARKRGETEQRLYLLNAWREAPVYTDRERAALAWTEAETLISQTRAPDDIYSVRAHFSETEIVNLSMLIATISAWNRLAISFRAIPPAKVSTAA